MFGFGAKTDEKYMKAALKEANKAYRDNDVPIGCVIVNSEGKVIAKAHNRRNRDGSTLSHAEILAIGQACKKVKDWRLEGCTMYVTLEPCQMCAGAIVQARMDRVVIGCMNKKAGCCGSVINLLQMREFNHQVQIESGILEEECSSIISDFFKELREEKMQLKAQEDEAEASLRVAQTDSMRKKPAKVSPPKNTKKLSSDQLSTGMTQELPADLSAEPAEESFTGGTAAPDGGSACTDTVSSSVSSAGTADSSRSLSDSDRLLEMDDLLRAALEAENGKENG